MRSLVLFMLFLCGPVAIAQSGAPALAEPMSVASLRSAPDGAHVTVRGEVTLVGRYVFLQDATGGMHLSTKLRPANLRMGDQVIATGYLSHGRYADSLVDGTTTFLFAGLPSPPLAVTATMASSGRYDNMLLETEGRLIRMQRAKNGLVLFLRAGQQEFTAEIPSELMPTLSSLPRLNSLLRVRGVCVMNSNSEQYSVPFHLLMRSANDQEVISGPPFWTRTHIALLALILLFITLASCMIYLRAERWRLRSVLEERTRLAHDLHDTLAQSFAGIGFQLQAIDSSLFSGHRDIKKHVDLAISLVADCHEDARRAIAMLKPFEPVTGDLLQALKQQGEQLTKGGDINFQISTEGSPLELSEAKQQTLLRVGHEAITNAIRHASPKLIAMTLAYEAEDIKLAICDDGVGFAPNEHQGHGFGLIAMRARAFSQNGHFSLTSHPGAGTTVTVTLPIQQIRKPTIRKYLRRYL